MEAAHTPQPTPFPHWLLPGLFLASRVMIFFWTVVQGADAFGDQYEYFRMGQLPGWPFFHYWSEYPPGFAFLNKLIALLSRGNEGLFFVLFSALLALAGAAVLYFFQRAAARICGEAGGLARSVALFGLLVVLPYTWWDYDLLPLALLMAGIVALLEENEWHAGLALGLGMLTKWFPGFALAAALRYRSRRSALKLSLIALGMVAVVLAGLYLASPVMTSASLASQPTRTSWQTVWAYVDGNRVTGWFVYWDWRLDPAQASVPRGSPARIAPRLTLALFLAAGLFFFWRVKNRGDRSLVSFIGITFALFLMWSPGWSPQWVMYLLPLILLTLAFDQALLMCAALLLITLFEWPLALGQFWFRAVFLMAGLRMAALAVLVFLWYRRTRAA